MESNITNIILITLYIALLAVVLTVAVVYVNLLMKHPCPHCRALISKKAAVCPRCEKAALAAN